jgi:hypothetical protein
MKAQASLQIEIGLGGRANGRLGKHTVGLIRFGVMDSSSECGEHSSDYVKDSLLVLVDGSAAARSMRAGARLSRWG